MLKYSHFRAETEFGYSAIPLHSKADAIFEKVASEHLLPEVTNYISQLRPQRDSQYVLVNAMGAGEYYGSNVNGDYFSEASLIHAPDDWEGNPLFDRARAKNWPYGFPTFYRAHPYAHHRNKDASRAFGEVELALWNPQMKRVELVTRVDKDKCSAYGGQGTWDKLKAGGFPDVSMGCVPAGTRVTLLDGSFRAMEQMQQADLVLSHLGRPKRVDQLHRFHYKGTLYKFKAYGFRRELCLTANHPLWLARSKQFRCKPISNSPQAWDKELAPRQRHCTPMVSAQSRGCSTCSVTPEYSFEWVRADQAEVGDYVAFAVPDQVDTTITNELEARFLGYYLAEGHVGDYNARIKEQITFSLGFTETDLAAEIEQLGRALGAQVTWHHEDEARGARYVTVVSKTLAERCIHFCGSGAKTKKLSVEALYMPVGLQLQFLGTYLNGDGGTYKGAAYFSTASEQLAQQIFIILARCGIIASINQIEHTPSEKSVVQKETTEFQVWVGTDFSYLLGAFTKKPVRKSLKIRGQRFFYTHADVRYVMSPITEIEEEDYNDDVFNISVEDDDSYMGELLATHNTKVPFDTCSICLDWQRYRDAMATFDPVRHRHPGIAALDYHKNQGAIRGLSITRADYCEHALKQMNKILPDGRKVFVYNDWPSFFDISFVFIGADKTAKTMYFIFSSNVPHSAIRSSAEIADELGVQEGYEEPTLKTASINDEVLKLAFGHKLAKQKRGEINKQVVPSQFAGKAVPLLTQCEEDLPNETLDRMSAVPPENLLSTLGGMGVLLRPREFQRLTLLQLGQRSLADQLDRDGEVFERSNEREDMGVKAGNYLPALAEMLSPLMSKRSFLAPEIERRIVMVSTDKPTKTAQAPSHSKDLLDKIAAAYNGYRQDMLELAAHSQHLLASAGTTSSLQKLAAVPMSEVFSPLSAAYIRYAYDDEFGTP